MTPAGDWTEVAAGTPDDLPSRYPPAVVEDKIAVPGVAAFLRPLVWDVGPPTAAYYLTRVAGGPVYVSLLAATGVAGLRVGYIAFRRRRFDAIAAFLVTVCAVGLAASLLTGSPRLMIAKDSIPTAAAGLVFLGSCAVGRPLTYAWAKRMTATTPDEERRWAIMWADRPGFRRTFQVMAVAWGCGLLLEAAIRLALVFIMPADAMAALSSTLSIITITALAAWTVWYARRVQR
ncbi:MAG TPA: VC0807 family protein [Jatrophihabitantaceae bacterium]